MVLAAPQHSQAFLTRRFLNWFPLGLAYGFLYMGRYNLTVLNRYVGSDVMSNEDFGAIFGIGSIVYAFGFLVTGPLTDRIGGRRAMLIAVGGALTMNAMMGMLFYGNAHLGWSYELSTWLKILYAGNMAFQSFGAIAIVTTKAPWFHVRERGTFSTIFGIMISAGIYFAFDWGGAIAEATRASSDKDLGITAQVFAAILPVGDGKVDGNWWLFFTPAIILCVLWICLALWLRNTPAEAGYDDFDTGEDALSDDGERMPVLQLVGRIFRHPVIIVICGIEFCSGVVRNGIMHWHGNYAKQTENFTWVSENWGLALLMAGVTGAFLTGWASDKFFNSRRAPMAGILYGVIFVSLAAMWIGIDDGWVVALGAVAISMGVIGVHGIMSGTSTVDFGGSKNGGAVVGIVDGLVYLGSAVQSFALGMLVPPKGTAATPDEFAMWPLFILPFALVGLLLSVKIWNAAPKKTKTQPVPRPPTPADAAGSS